MVEQPFRQRLLRPAAAHSTPRHAGRRSRGSRPPARSQGRRHRGPTPASFAYWHWDAHRHSFDRSGTLTGELLLHWGGHHATVAAGLDTGPAGFAVVDGGPRSAFRLDRITHRDDDGLPDPSDPDGVRQFLDTLGEPLDRGASRSPSPTV
ncbi:hypothetical protein ACFY65_13105 [Streptomyces cellulosae]